MLQLIKEKNRLQETQFIVASVLICFGLSSFRVAISETKFFFFLNWNLFLAVIPWIFTSLAILSYKAINNKIVVALLIAFWLLFFPNAPYILTDLFHLKLRSTMPMWFDLILILSYAWVGLFIGFLSLMDIEQILVSKFNFKYPRILSATLLFISSFGIYLGRFLRWNSWDVISEPTQLIFDIGTRFIHPFQHPTTWGVTFFMGLFLNLAYWSFRFISNRSYHSKAN